MSTIKNIPAMIQAMITPAITLPSITLDDDNGGVAVVTR